MHRYATPTPEARELVAELEFVWDQIKNIDIEESVGSGGSGGVGYGMQSQVQGRSAEGERGSARSGSGKALSRRSLEQQQQQNGEESDIRDGREERDGDRRGGRRRHRKRIRHEVTAEGRLRILSPVSHGDEVAERRYNPDQDSGSEDSGSISGSGSESGEDEFDDADDGRESHSDDDEEDSISSDDFDSSKSSYSASSHNDANTDQDVRAPQPSRRRRRKTLSNNKNKNHKDPWRTRIESALTRSLTELSALRELLDTHTLYPNNSGLTSSLFFNPLSDTSLYTASPHGRKKRTRLTMTMVWIRVLLGAIIRHVLLDLFVLIVLAWWRRWRYGDARLEEWIVRKGRDGSRWIGAWLGAVGWLSGTDEGRARRRNVGWRLWVRRILGRVVSSL